MHASVTADSSQVDVILLNIEYYTKIIILTAIMICFAKLNESESQLCAAGIKNKMPA